MQDKAKADVIPQLTGIRFLPVLMVFVLHYNSVDLYGQPLFLYFNHFYTGVNIFFVLSGFLIAYQYFNESLLTPNSLRKYALNRFARVYPLYFILTTVTFLVPFWQLGQGSFPLTNYLLNITFLKGYSLAFFFSGIYPSWSLAVEVMFYFLAPVIFFLMARKRIFFPQVILLLVAGFLITSFFIRYPYYQFFYNYKFTLASTFFGRAFEFFVGIWLALHIKKNCLNKPGKTHFVAGYAWTALGFAAILGTILLLSIINPRHAAASPMNYAAIGVSSFVFPICVAVFFYGLITEKTLIQRCLNTPFLQLLGKSSYAFFLIHTGIIAEYISFNIAGGSTILLFILLYLVAILLYKFCEYPLNLWLRRVMS